MSITCRHNRQIPTCWHHALLFACVILAPVFAQTPITRINLYDKSNNHLMFVTFEYDGTGTNTGRTVHMADSTYMRTTTIQRDPTGLIQKESSVNTVGDPVFITQFSTVGGKATFSIADLFNLDQLGAPVSYSGDGTNYDITQRSAIINKMRYSTSADGTVRIDVLDNAGTLQYYATTANAGSGVVSRQTSSQSQRTSLRMLGSGRCRSTVTLAEPSLVTLELFQHSGRRVAVLLKEKFTSGTHVFNTRTPTDLATGNYLMRLSVNGTPRAALSGPTSAPTSGLTKTSAAPTTVQLLPPSLIYELFALNGDLESIQKPKYRSPTALVASPDGKKLYVAEQTAKRIAVIDTATKTVTSEILLPNEPTGIAVSADGTTLYVTCSSERWPAGTVCVVNPASGKVTRTIAVGHSARSPVLSPDGTILYVCNWFDNTVSVVDLAGGKETGRIAVTREPYAAAITPDGKTLVVTNSLPDQAATDTVNMACKVTLIKTATRTVDISIALPVGSHSLFGVCVSPDGGYAYATHLIGRMNIPGGSVVGGWVHSNNLAVIDIANRRLINDIELDDMNHGTANPWGITGTADGKFLCVAHAGSNELTMIDLPAMMVKVKGAVDLSHDFTALQGIKKVILTAGKAPRSLAIIGTKAYVAGYFADSLDVVNIGLSGTTAGRIPLGSGKPMTVERKGEFLFTDASLCYQKWQSCSSCHPFTRPDALNWILSQVPNQAPRNVKSMLHTYQTPPTTWTGRRPNAWESTRKGIEIELLTTSSEDIAIPLDTFLMRLKPVPSPFLEKGKLSVAAIRGQAVYNKIDCAFCHPKPLYTDLNKWSAGVADPAFETNFDTPPLIEIWRTAPYDHIGSQTTLEGIIKVPGHSTSITKVTTQEFSDLIAFLRSL